MDAMAAPLRPWSRAVLAGLLGCALFFAVGWVTAELFAPRSAPHLVLGAAVVDAAPPLLVDTAIDLFGAADKVVLAVVLAVVSAGVAVLIARVATGHPFLGELLVAGLGVLCLLLALTRPEGAPVWVLPSVLATVAAVFGLHRITRAPAPGAQPSRRVFVRSLAGMGIATVLATAGGIAVAGVRRSSQSLRAHVHLPAPARPAPPIPAGAQVDLPQMPPLTTPNQDFYRVDTALIPPRVDPEQWRLRIHGLTEQDMELTYADLLAEDLVQVHLTLTCVSNPVGGDLAGNATWLGVPLRRLLQRAGPQQEADMVLSRSVDGFTAGTPLPALTDDRGALLAVGMNGQVLPVDHGFPVRMVVPGLYGYVSATKWVTDLEVTRFDRATAYWTERGWAPRAPIKTAARIDVPRSGDTFDGGTVMVGGTAWAQHRGVRRVQVRVDDGPWREATLATEVNIDTWRQWFIQLEGLTPGEHRITCRAWDPSGSQTATVAPPVPNGSSGYHSVTVTARE